MTDRTVELLTDIRRWLRLIGIQEAKPVLKDVLSHDKEEKQRQYRKVYGLTDGSRSAQEIADEVDVGDSTVSRWQRDWAQKGLLDRPSPSDSWRHIVDLDQVGLEYEE